MSQPGLPGNRLEPNAGELARRLADLERRLTAVESARSLESAAIGKGGLRSEDFDGQLDPPAAGTVGWALSGAGGGTAIFNDLVLRGSIIGDDALENPVSPLAVHADNTGFTLSTTATEKCRATVTPPAGFTRALVMAIISADCLNNTGNQDYLLATVDINGVSTGWGGQSVAFPGGATTVLNSGAALIDPCTPNFYVRAMLSTGVGPWTLPANNVVNVDALVIFLR